MAWLLKFLLIGETIGTTAVVTPTVIVPKIQNFYDRLKWDKEKVDCHGNKNFGLKVLGKVRVWANSSEELEKAKQEKYKGQGEVVTGNHSLCS